MQSKGEGERKKGIERAKEYDRGEGRPCERGERERERRWARNIGTECMHDALGNDIDIMAEPTK